MPKKSIYLMSTAKSSGKTAISIGLFLAFKEVGKKNPGYFKPIGDPFSDVKVTKADKDVNVVHKMLNRKYSREEICPIFISPTGFLDEIPFEKTQGVKELIKGAYDEMAGKTDIMIVEGNHDYNQFYTLGLNDPQFAKLLNSEIIFISKMEDDNDLDKLIIAIEKVQSYNASIKGIILTNVSELQITKIKEKYAKIIKDKGVELLGTIPASRLLSAPTVAEVIEATKGNVLTDDLEFVKDKIVEKFIIGAMQCNDALAYLRKSPNTSVITGGDRTDIILTAIEVGVSLIILTGNIQPDVVALAKAKDAGIPVVLVLTDTYTTAHNIQNIKTQIQQGEIQLCKQQILDHVDWKKLM